MQLVAPALGTKEVLREMHNGGASAHSGINKTLSKVREIFYCIRCREDVENWCNKCKTCAAVKGPKGSPFGRTAVDIGSLPITEEGNKYMKKIKGYGNLLQGKRSNVHEMLCDKNRVIE